MSGNGGITLANNAKLTVNSTTPSTFGGSITGGNPQSDLIKTGPATLTLTGAGAYPGVTTVRDGVLQVGDGGTVGALPNTLTSSVSIEPGTTLRYSRSDSFGLPTTIGGAGTLEQAGTSASVITLGGNLTLPR